MSSSLASIPVPARKSESASSGAEWIWILGSLLIWLLLNLWTGSRSPPVWNDEVMFTDPAANAFFGRGFTSTAWPFSGSHQLWITNAPLHTWLLVPWIHLWGFSITSVRSLNYVFWAGASLLVWIGVRRSGLVRGAGWRLLLIVLILCENGMAFSYRSGRYDSIGVLLCSALGAAASMAPGRARSATLVFCAFWIPFAGLQLLAFLALGFAVIFTLGGKRTLRLLVPTGIGLILGGLGLAATLKALGGWDDLRKFATSYTAPAEPGNRFTQAFLDTLSSFGGRDPSLPLILVALLLVWISGRRREAWDLLTGNRIIPIMLLIALAVPLEMGIIGHFPVYYSWMTALPLLIGTLALFSQISRPPWLRVVAINLLLAAGAIGLPLRLLLTFHEWRQRDYARVETYVRDHIQPGEKIGADVEIFYALQDRGAVGYYPLHLPAMSPAEKAQIHVLLVSPPNFSQFQEQLGGQWEKVDSWGESPAGRWNRAPLYRLDLYRRLNP
jgi:hypothetical protein